MTTFRAKHREAAAASRRLNLAFWLAALASYFSYSLACALTLFGISPLIAVYSGQHFVSRYLWLSLAFGLVPTGIMLLAYSDARRKMRERSAGEQARALGAEPTRDNSARDRRYTNLVAEMSAASGNPPPETYIHRRDMSINAFILSGADDSLALTISQGALDSLSRDELQAVIAHEYGHIENGDLALYSHLTAILHGYYTISEWQNRQDHIHTAPEANLFDLRGLLSNEHGYNYTGGILALFGSIHYLCGRLLQAAFSRQREHMADARAVQYTRHPDALIGALKKALALQHDGVRLIRPPLDRAHIYFIYYQSAQNRLLRTHPPLRERIKTWGGGNISGAELRAILSNIDACRNNRAAAPLQPIAPLPEPNPSYPPATYDRLLAAKLQPAPDDPVAALLAYFAYHSGAAYAELEKAALLPGAMQTACRRAYNTIEQSDPLQRLALIAYLSRAALNFNIATKRYLDPIIRRLIQHDGELSRYEHTAYLYNYLAADDPDDPNPQTTYQRLLTKGPALSQPPAWQPLNTGTSASSLQLCRHGDTLRRLAYPYRQSLHNNLTNYYRQKPQLTLKQAHLRFALQHLLMPQALPAGE